MIMDMLRNASIVGKLGALVALAPVVVALAYAIWPTERRLALMRPLSLAAIFGGLTSLTVGLASVLMDVSATGTLTRTGWANVAADAGESIIGLFVACGCLTIAWLLIVLGMRRA